MFVIALTFKHESNDYSGYVIVMEYSKTEYWPKKGRRKTRQPEITKKKELLHL